MRNKLLYDVIYVGAGPANVFSLLSLIHDYSTLTKKLKIALIEQGNSLFKRERKEVTQGFAGCGAFSDNKLTKSLKVGGNIDLTEQQYNYYADIILGYYSMYGEQNYSWELKKQKSLNEFWVEQWNSRLIGDLIWLHYPTVHIGTDKGVEAFKRMEEAFKNNGVDLFFNEEVIDIEENTEENIWNITTKGQTDTYNFVTKNLVLGTGQRGSLLSQLKKFPAVNFYQKSIQLGIRVEDKMNDVYKKLLEANYDFKLTQQFATHYARTFCVNSGVAEVTEEDNGGLFKSYNGHSYKEGKDTGKINYGVMVELYENPLHEVDLSTKEKQINYMKKVNKLLPVEGFSLGTPRNLLNDFAPSFVNGDEKVFKNTPIKLYPTNIARALSLFLKGLSKLIDLSEAVYYFPEVKITGEAVEVSPKFEVLPGLFVVGDASVSKGIIQAGISGLIATEKLVQNLLYDVTM